MATPMFCRQCEQAAQGKGCEIMGNCGKTPKVSALQDLMLHGLKGVAIYADLARELGIRDDEVDLFMLEGLFTTVTNVDFDPVTIAAKLKKCYETKERMRELYEQAWRKRNGTEPAKSALSPARWIPMETADGLVAQGGEHGVLTQHDDPDVLSAIELVIHGLKGMGAFAWHAWYLGKRDEEVPAFIHRALHAVAQRGMGLQEYVDLALECGMMNLKTMELLYQGHEDLLGAPQPMKVNLGTRAGRGIVVSGHDLLMLDELLKQSAGKGINVYTHGEMLPAHGYPGLRKYPHFAGHFGTAWQDQARELPHFSGAIIFNTNCIQKPDESYMGRLFTWGETEWPGARRIAGMDFSEVIKAALDSPELPEEPGQEITVGFGHKAVLGVADKVVDAVKQGAVRHFFLIGGCDGAKPGRNYYTEIAQKVPADCVILTLACGKNRFNRLEFGDIGGIPRLLDVGQCNDAYSAIKIALALAEAFSCEVNDLPLSLVLSWYEQKAHVILLTLLALGVKNIILGPSLPAYVSPAVLEYLSRTYGLRGIGTPEGDLKDILG